MLDVQNVPLGGIAEFRNGVNFSRDHEGSGTPILKVKDFGSLRVVPTSNLDELDPKSIAIPDNQFLQPKDIVIIRSNGNRNLVGRSMIFEGSPSKISFSGFCIRARVDCKQAVPEFVHYWLRCPETREIFSREGSGTGIQNLSQNLLSKLIVRLPCLSVQHIIADVLGSLDDKIELNRRMNATLEGTAQAIFRDWFVDFGPTRRKQAGVNDPVQIMGDLLPDPTRAQPLADLFPPSFGDDGLPEGWEEKELSEIGLHEKAAVAPGKSPDEIFAHFSIPAFDADRSPVLQPGEAIKSNKTLVPDDAVLLSKLNPEIERVWIPTNQEKRSVCSTEFLVFTGRKPFRRSYLYCLFSDEAFRTMLRGMVTGTSKSHQRVSPKALSQRTVTVPSDMTVRAFEQIASAAHSRMLHNLTEAKTLAATHDLLLPKLMSGEIRLGDAERMMEDAA